MTDMALPTTPDGITADWLSAALQHKYPGTTVTNAEIVDIIWGTSTKIRVALRYNDKGAGYGLPPTMIVKGGFEEHSQRMKFLYLREMRFYRDLQPVITLPSPECYYAGTDPNPHAYQSIVIMEDLKRDGIEFCDPLRPQRLDQVARRLAAMAVYHAEMWNSPEFRPGGRFDWIEENLTGKDWEFYRDRYMEPQMWQHYVESPRGAAVSVRLHDGNQLKDALAALRQFHTRFPRTLVDGDTHLGNLYIYPDGSPGFFDMQVNVSPWFHDVTYHLICALDIADRRKWERPLLMHYLDALKAQGVPATPDFDEAFECYRRDAVWGLFVFMINETVFQTEAINTAYAARFADAVLAHDTMRLLLG